MQEKIFEHSKLQFISHFTDTLTYIDGIQLALEGGCRWIQLRMKDATNEEVLPIALQTQEMCKKFDATFIIDDRVQMVKQIKADGVHLGKNDMPIAEARQIFVDDFIIGGTANTFEDVKAHYEAGANYIGCGPFQFTTTKQRLSPILGLDGYRRIVNEMKTHHISIPIVAIGGITLTDIPAIMKTGVTGIALSGSILKATDPIEETNKILNNIKQWKS